MLGCWILATQACCIIYDFESSEMAEDKDLKRLTLLEIVECVWLAQLLFRKQLPRRNLHQVRRRNWRRAFVRACRYVTNTKHCFTEQTLPEAVKMIAANIFRPLPPSTQRSLALAEPEDEEQRFDVSWPHVQAVYEIFLWVMLSNDVSAALAYKCIDQNFILRVSSSRCLPPGRSKQSQTAARFSQRRCSCAGSSAPRALQLGRPQGARLSEDHSAQNLRKN